MVISIVVSLCVYLPLTYMLPRRRDLRRLRVRCCREPSRGFLLPYVACFSFRCLSARFCASLTRSSLGHSHLTAQLFVSYRLLWFVTRGASLWSRVYSRVPFLVGVSISNRRSFDAQVGGGGVPYEVFLHRGTSPTPGVRKRNAGEHIPESFFTAVLTWTDCSPPPRSYERHLLRCFSAFDWQMMVYSRLFSEVITYPPAQLSRRYAYMLEHVALDRHPRPRNIRC